MSFGGCFAVFDTGNRRPGPGCPVLLFDLSGDVGAGQECLVDAQEDFKRLHVINEHGARGPGTSAD